MAALMLLLAIGSLINTGSDGQETPTLPSRVNLSDQVLYHGRAGEDLTGEAGLSMIFDFHGEYIMQQDIRNVSKGLFGSGVANTEELIKAAHYSAGLPQSPKGYSERDLGYGGFYYDWNDDNDRVDRRFSDLYTSLADRHPVLCYTYLDIPPKLNPDPKPPDPNNPQPPDPKVTPEDLAALEKVWRLVVGYDSNQGNGILIIHDPVPIDTGFLGGESKSITREDFDLLWNVYELDDGRISTHRYGMTASPWEIIDLEHPKSQDAGTEFEITANISYRSPRVMIGASVNGPMATLMIPDDFSFVSGNADIDLSISNPGSNQEISWLIKTPDRAYAGQDWTFYLNATGNVTVGNPEPHLDSIGTSRVFEVEAYGYLNHPPVIEASMIDPDLIPDDGSVQPLVATSVKDEDGNIQSVTIDLLSISGNSQQRMYDDASNGDETSGDGIYSYRIRKKMDQGEHIFKITVKDTKGGRAYDNVTIVVEDIAHFTKAPDIIDKGVFPMGVPNDGITTSVVWAIVEDDEGDLERVEVDLSEVGGEDAVRMYDDGTSGDNFAGDGNFSVEFTVSPLIALSIYQVEITAYDRAGHETSTKTWVDVILPPVPPVILAASTLPEEVPNDATSKVVLSVVVEDDNDDVESVWVDLTPLKGPNFVDLKDDGISPDMSAGDGTWTVEFTVGYSVSDGLKGKIDVIAEDSTGLRGTISFSLTVTKANVPPDLVTYNVTDSDGAPVTEFSEGEKVIINVLALDDDLDILTVRVDLSDFDSSPLTLTDDDEDGRFNGDFTIPENTSAGSYNITITVSDPAGATDHVRIRIMIKGSEDAENQLSIGSDHILIGAGVGFFILLVLVIAVAMRRRPSVAGPPMRPGAQRPMMPPGRVPYGAQPMAGQLR